MGRLRQVAAITLLNLRTVPQRLGSSVVAIVGIAGVVVVLVAVLSIAEGFRAAMQDAGSPSRAIVMRSGADAEMTSGRTLRHHRPAQGVDRHQCQCAHAGDRAGGAAGA
jgi:putative ABC transport system permease protein